MTRQYVDCREIPSESKCTVAISADSEKELIDVAVQHAVKVHGHRDTPEFRQMLRQAIKQGSPPNVSAARRIYKRPAPAN
jgi:predicted small metal-binding protein